MIRLNSGVQSELGKAWMLRAVGSSYQAIPVGFHAFGEKGQPTYNADAAYWLLNYAPSPLDAKLKDFLKTYICRFLYHKLEWDDTAEEQEDFDFNEEAGRLFDLWAFTYNHNFGLEDSRDQIVSDLFDLIEDMSLDEIKELGSQLKPDDGDFVADYIDETFVRVRMNDAYQSIGGTEGVCYFRIYSHSRNWVNQIWAFVYDHKEIQAVVVERDDSEFKLYIDNMRREEFLSKDHLPFLGSRTL